MTSATIFLPTALAGLALAAAAVFFARRAGAAAAASAPEPKAPGRPPPQPAAADDFAPGYRIIRLIDQGGMGTVYEAEDLTLGRRVAVKRMRPELSRDGQDKELFLREARIVAALHHPNIVDIHTVGHGQGELYLVFEYVAGVTLQEVIRDRRRLDPDVTRRIIRQVGAALAYAHGQKILHCDLKPSNIMITLDSRVKVMDFGIARQARETLSRLTPGTAFGTLAYMSPEQHLGREKRQTDLYALGVTIYEMLTGRIPFAGAEMLLLKEHARFAPLSRVVPGLPPAADAFMTKALAPQPEARFQTADELCAALERVFPS